ncbi:uncharacterized protein [Palaemon carinicauda]|uniref:uncharacterized protein n=1 Tax=Palaemon carinicauda TaxID=392227 RepID=UPI0035B58CFC
MSSFAKSKVESSMEISSSESATLFRKQGNYSTINGNVESPAASADSANEWTDLENGMEGRAHKGLSMMMGAMFLIGEMAGAGVLNLPKAIANTGWVGVPMLGVLCAMVGYSGTRLAHCWVMLEERWPEYRAPCRRPYPAIAYRALGKFGQYVTEVALNVTLFGAATVFLLVTTQMIHQLLWPLKVPITPCEWILIVGGLLILPTWLGTPKDMWPISILAVLCTFVACVVVMAEVFIERKTHPPPEFPAPSFTSFFLGFGSILFALGGASLFPTVQNDMKNRAEFGSSVIVTFLVLLSLYWPMSIVCYGTLGNAVEENILMSVNGVAVTITKALILCHFIFATIIVINPVMQTIEGILYVRNRFSIARCITRTLVMFVVILMAMAVPTFGKILDLIGGSSVTLLSFIMPPVCYFKLCNTLNPITGLAYTNLSLRERIILFTIATVGLVGGVASSYSALREILSPEAFSNTCFSKSSFL